MLKKVRESAFRDECKISFLYSRVKKTGMGKSGKLTVLFGGDGLKVDMDSSDSNGVLKTRILLSLFS